ncbi:hypothetical protein [Streptomyces sp. NPDC093261]|uniref:hypothetical protein n=1 Tax=Streptomyces sp. NPDC093261 TaxID=3366037 RepID=UPI0038013203
MSSTSSRKPSARREQDPGPWEVADLPLPGRRVTVAAQTLATEPQNCPGADTVLR